MTFEELSLKAVASWAAEHSVLVSLSPLSVWHASSPANIGHQDMREIVIGYGKGGNLSAEEAIPHLMHALERLMDKAVSLALRLNPKEDPRHCWGDVLVKIVHVRPQTSTPSTPNYFDHQWSVNLLVVPIDKESK